MKTYIVINDYLYLITIEDFKELKALTGDKQDEFLDYIQNRYAKIQFTETYNQ